VQLAVATREEVGRAGEPRTLARDVGDGERIDLEGQRDVRAAAARAKKRARVRAKSPSARAASYSSARRSLREARVDRGREAVATGCR
jgi:hypothetical protein